MICIHHICIKRDESELYSSVDLFQRKAQPFSIEPAEKMRTLFPGCA